MILFVLGVIIGILVRDIKFEVLKELKKSQENLTYYHTHTQFFEPVTKKEKFEGAKSVDDLLI